MSLLMKALEKAAKDRGEARSDNTAPSAESRPELSLALELLAADTPSPRMREEARPDTIGTHATASANYGGEMPRMTPGMRAGRDAERSAGSYLRAHPLLVFGTCAGVFAV